MNFLAELKRRNVIRVAVAYTVAAWLLAQVFQLAAESFEAPAWVMKMLITALVIGLPVVLVFSWAYEITPEGLKLEKDVAKDTSITHETGKKLNYLTIILLVLVAGLTALDRLVLTPRITAEEVATLQAARGTEARALDAGGVEANSIAVLPFVNMSADPEQEYFSDGISEELLNLLVRVEGLTVASRTSSFAYKGAPSTSITEIASDLRVAHVLEGSVRKAGNQVRITAQLINTLNDRHLWSDSYDRELTDIFAIQDEIANAIVNALRAELGMETTEKAVTVEVATENLDAYELYLKGREFLIARSNLAESVRLLESAVELDPGFARAWANLAAAAYVSPGWGVTGRDYESIAVVAVERALELDDSLSMAWAVRSRLGDSNGKRPSFEQALAYLETALQEDPKNATAWLWRGIEWSELGFHDHAMSDFQECLAIDPAYFNCLLHASQTYVLTGQDNLAVQHFEKLAQHGFLTYPHFFLPMFVRREELLVAYLAAHHTSNHPDFPDREWVEALQYPGRDYSAEIARAEKWMAAESRGGIYNPLMLAFGAYDRLRVFPAVTMNWIWQPGFPGFHESGHFKRMVNELGLPDYWRKHGFPPQCRPLGDDDFECDVP